MESLMIIIDNTMSMQNQDYLPQRYILETETIRSIINKKLCDSFDNAIGIVPISMLNLNHIITPTGEKKNIIDFLNKLKLNYNNDLEKAVEFAIISNEYRYHENKRILIFWGSNVNNSECVLKRIKEAVEKKIYVSVVFFGEGREYYDFINSEMQDEFYNSGIVNENDDLYSVTMALMAGYFKEDYDPELEMALKLSLQEAEGNK